jgi:DNA-binding transcriptional MerR regulator
VIFLEYSIGEFSKLTNLGIHTLRYYEHENLITPKRNSSNRRCYSDKDLAWIEFIKRLKDTRMPIKDIQRYAELRAEGDLTLNERMEMLTVHRESLNEQIKVLQEHMAKLDDKIDFYRQEIERKSEG